MLRALVVVKDGGPIGALVSTEDILPTLADLVGLPAPPYPLTGTSLAPLLDDSRDRVRALVVTPEATRQASLALRTARRNVIVPLVADAARPLDEAPGITV